MRPCLRRPRTKLTRGRSVCDCGCLTRGAMIILAKKNPTVFPGSLQCREPRLFWPNDPNDVLVRGQALWPNEPDNVRMRGPLIWPNEPDDVLFVARHFGRTNPTTSECEVHSSGQTNPTTLNPKLQSFGRSNPRALAWRTLRAIRRCGRPIARCRSAAWDAIRRALSHRRQRRARAPGIA
jgi:hypothetical protein